MFKSVFSENVLVVTIIGTVIAAGLIWIIRDLTKTDRFSAEGIAENMVRKAAIKKYGRRQVFHALQDRLSPVSVLIADIYAEKSSIMKIKLAWGFRIIEEMESYPIQDLNHWTISKDDDDSSTN